MKKTPKSTATKSVPMAFGIMDRLLGLVVRARRQDPTNSDPHHEREIMIEIGANEGPHLDLALENAIIIADHVVSSLPMRPRCSRHQTPTPLFTRSLQHSMA